MLALAFKISPVCSWGRKMPNIKTTNQGYICIRYMIVTMAYEIIPKSYLGTPPTKTQPTGVLVDHCSFEPAEIPMAKGASNKKAGYK